MELVDDSTTHVVCGDSRRTLNVMRGVIRGIHLVTYQWVSCRRLKLFSMNALMIFVLLTKGIGFNGTKPLA